VDETTEKNGGENMSREDLEKLGLSEDQVNGVMKLKSGVITNLETENHILTNQLEKANKEIQSYKDMDIDGMKKSLEDLKNVTDENKDLKAQIKMVDCGVKKEFSKFVRNEVMSKVDDKTDFETALENYKKENSQYFGETVVKKVQSSPNLNGGVVKETTTNDIMNSILRGSTGNE